MSKRGERFAPGPGVTGYVYFIESAKTHRVKIGVARDPLARLASLQSANPETLRLVGVIPTDQPRAVEKRLHWFFEAEFLRGEWFRRSSTLMAVMRATLPYASGVERFLMLRGEAPVVHGYKHPDETWQTMAHRVSWIAHAVQYYDRSSPGQQLYGLSWAPQTA